MSHSGSNPKTKALARRVGKHYLGAKAQTSTPLDLLILTHEGAIKAAHQENADQLKSILELLIKGLNFDRATIFAIGQLRVYKHCIQAANVGAFSEVIHLLSPMLEAWCELRASGGSLASSRSVSVNSPSS